MSHSQKTIAAIVDLFPFIRPSSISIKIFFEIECTSKQSRDPHDRFFPKVPK